MNKIAVLITSHNRKEKTMHCLSALFSCELSSWTIQVYLVDDGSSDGTSDMVKEKFPHVMIIRGTGDLFWAGGMRLAWEVASSGDPDGYLLLNDDTILYKDALATLLETHLAIIQKYGIRGISIGSTCDPDSGEFTYGGFKLKNKITSHVAAVQPDPNKMRRCDMANANIMLIPKEVALKVGELSKAFTHSLADFDYTLRASRAGIPVMVCKSYCGTCVNDHGNSWVSADQPLQARINYLKDAKHLAYQEYLHYMKIHFPLYWPVSFVMLWLKALVPGLWDRFKT